MEVGIAEEYPGLASGSKDFGSVNPRLPTSSSHLQPRSYLGKKVLWAVCHHLIYRYPSHGLDYQECHICASPADATFHDTLASTEAVLLTRVPAPALTLGKDLHGHRISEA